MKTQFSRFFTILYAISVTFVFTATLAATAVGCSDDDENSKENTESIGSQDGGDISSPYSDSQGNNPGMGSSDLAGESDEASSEEDESDEASEEDGESEDESEDDDEGDSDDGDDEDDSDEDDDEGDSDDGDDEGDSDDGDDEEDDNNESSDDTGDTSSGTQCTQNDLSQCSDSNITGGMLPMEICCTEDGFCGSEFSMGDFSTGCISDQFPDSLITEDCDECANTNCEDEVSTCENNAACSTLSNCLMTCNELMSCASCIIDNMQGLGSYGNLAACALDACGSTCTDQFSDVIPPQLLDFIAGFGGGFPGAGGGVPGGFGGGF